MRCPSCSALFGQGIDQCTQCEGSKRKEPVARRKRQTKQTPSRRRFAPSECVPEVPGQQANRDKETFRLIAFPGASRSSVPQWRQALSERVREVQERRAREAALEAAVEERQPKEVPGGSPTPLELLSQTDVAQLNPLVAAALRRIERAHQPSPLSVNRSTNAAAAVAYAQESECQGEAQQEFNDAGVTDSQLVDNAAPQEESSEVYEAHSLVIVPLRATNVESEKSPKPRRMIAVDTNNAALNYLDSIPTSVLVETASHRYAPAFPRLLAAIVDLVIVGLLCAPVGAAMELANAHWQDYRVSLLGAGVFSVVSFLYLTISTAMTGRTLGMRLLSLRIVDARTGLIPTGKQSAGRALIHLVSLLMLGIGALYALFDSERQTAHDRLTHTVVVLV